MLPEPPRLPELPELLVATVPTDDTTPGVVVPSGSVMLILSPALTCDCIPASRATFTTCLSEDAVSTGPEAGLPSMPWTAVTRIADGSNTTDPRLSTPDGSLTPSAACRSSTATMVRHEK